MPISVDRGWFADEATAFAEIQERGFHALKTEVPPDTDELHWHDFDAVLYIVGGELTLRDAQGEAYPLRPGDRASVTEGTLHSEHHQGYSVVYGLSVPPATLTHPVNKPPVG